MIDILRRLLGNRMRMREEGRGMWLEVHAQEFLTEMTHQDRFAQNAISGLVMREMPRFIVIGRYAAPRDGGPVISQR